MDTLRCHVLHVHTPAMQAVHSSAARHAPRIQNVPVFLFTGNIMLVRASVDRSFGGAYHQIVTVPITSAWEEALVENQVGDQPVLNYIQRLVAEEHRLYEQGTLPKPIVSGSRKSRSNWISAGTSCASDVPFATSGLTRTKRKFARRRSSRIMSSRDLKGTGYFFLHTKCWFAYCAQPCLGSRADRKEWIDSGRWCFTLD